MMWISTNRIYSSKIQVLLCLYTCKYSYIPASSCNILNTANSDPMCGCVCVHLLRFWLRKENRSEWVRVILAQMYSRSKSRETSSVTIAFLNQRCKYKLFHKLTSQKLKHDGKIKELIPYMYLCTYLIVLLPKDCSGD